MSKRVVNDPSALGWVWDPVEGKWGWSSSSSGGGGAGGSFPEAPVDGKQYGRQDAGWTQIMSGGGTAGVTTFNARVGDVVLTSQDVTSVFTETDPVFNAHVASSITQADINLWNSGTGSSGVPEAPINGYAYARQNATWTIIESAGVMLTNPLRATFTTQDQANEYFYENCGVSSVNGQTGDVVETDPVFTASAAARITQSDIDSWTRSRQEIL